MCVARNLHNTSATLEFRGGSPSCDLDDHTAPTAALSGDEDYQELLRIHSPVPPTQNLHKTMTFEAYV